MANIYASKGIVRDSIEMTIYPYEFISIAELIEDLQTYPSDMFVACSPSKLILYNPESEVQYYCDDCHNDCSQCPLYLKYKKE